MRKSSRIIQKGPLSGAVGMLVIGLAAGCSSSAGSATGQQSTVQQNANQQNSAEKFTGSPITVAILQAFTGVYAVDGAGAGAGTSAAITAINQAGGVLGRKLESFDANTFGDTADSVPAPHEGVAG